VLQGPSGFKELKKGMNIIRSTGGYVTQRDGMHVHHGVPEVVNDKEKAIRLIQSWMDNTPHIEAFVAARRCGGGAYNPRWSADSLRQLQSPQAVEQPRLYNELYFGRCGPRGAINLHSLSEHGTIELRLFEGTLDYDIAEAWVRFGQRFFESVLKRKQPLPRLTNGEELLKRIRVSKRATERLLTKANGGYRDLTYHGT
jgi:hypothetical protein